MATPVIRPVRAEATVSTPAGGQATATIAVPAGAVWRLRHVRFAHGANSTVTAVTIDGAALGITADTDLLAEFGDVLVAQQSIGATFANAGAAAEDNTLRVVGHRRAPEVAEL